MSITNRKETINSEISNEDLPKTNENDNLKIKDIFPKAKLIPRANRLNIKMNSLKKEKRSHTYELNKEFLFALIQPIFLLDKQKMYHTISNLIKNSKLSKKLESESETNENINTLSITLAQNLIYKQIDKDDILYHTGETDNKFYFIIKGRMSELKASKYNLKITFDEYINYLTKLQNNKENYLLNKVILANNKEIQIKSIDDIPKIYNVIFKKKLIENISLEKISNNTQLEEFFKQYSKDFSTYGLSKKKLKKLEKDKNKIIMGVVNREWDDYIMDNCHPNSDDLLLFEPYEEIYKDKKKNYICYVYEISSNLTDGNYFGDFSLDDERIIRNETLKAEENTILGFITNEDYISIVSPSRKIEKNKEILLLNNGYFFKNISERIFKKNYFEMFVKKEYGMNTILFNSRSNPKSLIFLKKGKISLVLNCSIIELYNLIQLIYIKLNKISWPYDNFQKKILTKEDLKTIEKKYFSESILKTIKNLNKIFKLELEKKRKFEIALFSDLEIIGLEEVYLKIPYIAKGIVIGEKIICHELPLDKLNIILQDEANNVIEAYVKSALNRVLSLMERLHHLKQNYMNIARIKSEKESLDKEIININNSFNRNKEYNIIENYKNKVISDDNQIKNYKLKINNSRTLIPHNFVTKIKDNFITQNDSYDFKKNNLTNSRISSTNKNIRKRSALTIKSNDDKENSSFRNLSSKKKSIINLKSANKIRNKKLELEKNIISSRAGSVKLSELLKRNKIENIKKETLKRDDIIIIGNTTINIKKLKNKIKEYKSVDDIREMFVDNENKKINDINNINSKYSKDTNYIKIEEQYKDDFLSENQFKGNIIDNKIETIKSIKTNIPDKTQKYITNININENNIKKIRNNSLDPYYNQYNQINYTKLIMNPIQMNINPLNKRYIKYIKNKKHLNLNKEKYNINKKYIMSNTTSNNVSIINQTSNTYSNTNGNLNNDSTLLSILPKIQQKTRYNEYITKTSNSNSFKKHFNKKITGKIPEIVKDYYLNIKKRGYIPFIANKESNTLFLRKYHKKYKDVEDDSYDKSQNKNDKIFPRI